MVQETCMGHRRSSRSEGSFSSDLVQSFRGHGSPHAWDPPPGTSASGAKTELDSQMFRFYLQFAA